MLLWVLILALYGYCVAQYGRDLPATLKARVLAVQGMIGAAFLTFIILTQTFCASSTRRPERGGP
ncbi:MAG: hypothetical protein R3C40_04520 [Parvularculaceae bacterium]